MNQAGRTSESRAAVMIRSCRGDGQLIFALEFEEEAAEPVKIRDVKELLCKPPHSLCREASLLVLVLNRSILQDDAALVDLPVSRRTVITAVTLNSDWSTSGHNRARFGTSQEHTFPTSKAFADHPRQTHTGDLLLLQNPELRKVYEFWQAVEQFYHNHVSGDGRIDYSLMPSGVTEMHVKFFAHVEHALYANHHLHMPEDVKSDRDMSDFLQSLSAVGFVLIIFGGAAAAAQAAGSGGGSFEDFEHCAALHMFRRSRVSIFGLKNATWLNGAEGIIHDLQSISLSKTAVWLYWPPDAVKRNGGKRALLHRYQNTGPLFTDLQHMFEHSPQDFTSLLSREIDINKKQDSLCRVFLSLVDFNRIPNWRTPETLYRLHRELWVATRDYAERMLHDWCARFTQQQLEEHKEHHIRSVNTRWGCFLDLFPEMQLEVTRAISCLSDHEAGTHIQALLQAEDLVPSSDTHILDKFGLDPDFLHGSASDFVARPSQAKSHDIDDVLKYMSDSEREKFGKVQEFGAQILRFLSSLFEGKDSFLSGLKSPVSKLLEVFLFLIFRDRKEALRIISTRDFCLGVNEHSGGIFLLHLFSVFASNCFRDISTPDSSTIFDEFKTKFTSRTSLRPKQNAVLTRLPVAIAVLLHRDVCAHHLSCSCLKGAMWFPCDWPPHIKSHLLSFRIFQNLDKNPHLRRIFGQYSLFLELKPQLWVKPFDSIVLIKFAWKLWSDDLTVSRPHRVVDQPSLQVLEEDLRSESLGRAILAADSNAAELIASFFEADDLENLCRYIQIRNQCLDRVPVRILGLKKDVFLNGAEGVSDLNIDSNGRCRVHLQSPLHVVSSVKNGIASVDISKLEFLGQNVSKVAFYVAINSMRSIKIDFSKIYHWIEVKLPKIFLAFFRAIPDATLDTGLKAFLSKIGPVMDKEIAEDEQNFEKKIDNALIELLDFHLGLVNNLPFVSTMKNLLFQVLGSVGFWVRLSNPSTRPDALDYLRVQVRVLTSFDIPPAFLDAINGFLDDRDNANSSSKMTETGGSFEGFLRHTQEVSEVLKAFNLDPNWTADLLSFLQSAFLGDNVITEITRLWSKMQQPYLQFKQAGMPDALARAASFEQAVAENPDLFSAFQNAGENARDPFGLSKIFPSEVDGHPLVLDILDDRELVTDQRVVIKSDVVPNFLAAAEGIIRKRHNSGHDVYEVLIKKPASAVFHCHGERVRKIEKKHLQLLGKHLPKLDFSKDWIDEQDCLRLKNVDYWSMCPKSHPLRCAVPTMLDPRVNFCSTCARDFGSDEARSFCECGCVYSVCTECYLLLQHPAPHISSVPSSDDDAYVHVRFF